MPEFKNREEYERWKASRIKASEKKEETTTDIINDEADDEIYYKNARKQPGKYEWGGVCQSHC